MKKLDTKPLLKRKGEQSKPCWQKGFLSTNFMATYQKIGDIFCPVHIFEFLNGVVYVLQKHFMCNDGTCFFNPEPFQSNLCIIHVQSIEKSIATF